MEPLVTKTRVLVVEDEIVVSEDLQQRLVALGFEVVGAADTASDAIRLAISERPDVALFDGVMLVAGPMVGVRNTNENSLKLRSSVT